MKEAEQGNKKTGCLAAAAEWRAWFRRGILARKEPMKNGEIVPETPALATQLVIEPEEMAQRGNMR
ncbi:MAG TPA: hypothetical protein VI298_02120 [Geobacteraceae bacterium]